MEKLPVYVKIARDITNKILQGEFKEGDLLKGRSLLASTYNVSPETIRKALNILEEQKIVENKHGVGCFVDSIAYAKQFKDSWDNVETISRNHEVLNNILDKIQNVHDELKEAIDDFVTNVRFQVGETIDFKMGELALLKKQKQELQEYFKMQNVEYEKAKYLDGLEVKKILDKIRRQESKDLDEISVMLYANHHKEQ